MTTTTQGLDRSGTIRFFNEALKDANLSELFIDGEGRRDWQLYYEGDAISFALSYVNRQSFETLQATTLEWLDNDLPPFQYFALLKSQTRLEAPYANQNMQDVYWKALAITLARLFDLVQRPWIIGR